MSGAWVYNTARISDSLAMVIPVWFSSDVPRESILQLLCDSLMGWEAFVRPENLVLVVDGEQPHVEWALERLRGMLRGDAWRIEMLKTNLGKGGAVAHGIECALAGSDVQCVVIRDADNDHLLADLPPMVTVWQGVCEALRTCDVVVVGARHNLTAPLGWLRAQWETFLNHLIMQVVSYCRHRQGDAPCWMFVRSHPPDLQSGYKLYSRNIAWRVVQALRENESAYPETNVFRYGAEVVPMVELLVEGAIIAESPRRTYRGQPMSAYAPKDAIAMYGSKLLWVIKRTGVEWGALVNMFANAISATELLNTYDGSEQWRAMLNWLAKQLNMHGVMEQIASMTLNGIRYV